LAKRGIARLHSPSGSILDWRFGCNVQFWPPNLPTPRDQWFHCVNNASLDRTGNNM